jgi:hypothetical protein
MKNQKRTLLIGLGLIVLLIYILIFEYAVMLTVGLGAALLFIKNLRTVIDDRNKSNVIKLILMTLWILLFVYLGYSTYDVHGEDAMGAAILHIIITFPLSYLFVFILRNMNSVIHLSDVPRGLAGHVIFEVFFFAIGYLQWFIVFPWIIKKAAKYRQR